MSRNGQWPAHELLAQQEVHLSHKREVPGSNPSQVSPHTQTGAFFMSWQIRRQSKSSKRARGWQRCNSIPSKGQLISNGDFQSETKSLSQWHAILLPAKWSASVPTTTAGAPNFINGDGQWGFTVASDGEMHFFS